MIEWILAAALALSIAANAVLGGVAHFLTRSNEAMMRVISADYRRFAASDGGYERARAWSMYKRGADDNKQGDNA